MQSVIHRNIGAKIIRGKITGVIRINDEVQAGYAQAGMNPNHNTKSWYRDIYEFYQNNEC